MRVPTTLPRWGRGFESRRPLEGPWSEVRATQGSAASAADRAEEVADVGGVQVGSLVRREVAPVIVGPPVDDVAMVPLGEPADAVEVAPEPGETEGKGGRLGGSLRVLVLVVQEGGRGPGLRQSIGHHVREGEVGIQVLAEELGVPRQHPGR